MPSRSLTFAALTFALALTPTALSACGDDAAQPGDDTSVAPDSDTTTEPDAADGAVESDTVTSPDVDLDTTTSPDVDLDTTTSPDADPDTTTTPDADPDTTAADTDDTADTTTTPDTVTPITSCAGRCGQAGVQDACDCDASCRDRDDCCADFFDVCEGGCEVDGLTSCGDECVDTDTSLEHCGGCFQPCDVGANQVATCDGTCHVACALGFEDCNGNPADGCEAELARDNKNCGECLNKCATGPFAVAACQGGNCVLDCNDGRGACNDSAIDGCETPLAADPTNCGGCGITCPGAPNAHGTCGGEECDVACDDGFDDCNGVRADGCEADLDHDEATCGACDRACGPAESCNAGACACDGTFTFLVPPTPASSNLVDAATFTLALTCGVAASSLDDPSIVVAGAAGGAVAGVISADTPNLLRWTATGTNHLFGGEAVDITIGSGFRSFDSLKTSTARVLQARVLPSASGSGVFVAGGSVTTAVGQHVSLGDFDGDGDLDLASSEGLYLNDGTGAFGAKVRSFGQLFGTYAADLNGDGYTDLYAEHNQDTGLDGPCRVHWGAATNPLATTTNVNGAAFAGQRSPVFGDIDGDGDRDIITYSSQGSPGRIEVWKVSPPSSITSAGTVGATQSGRAVLLDVDGDGDLDIVQGNVGLERLYLNDGSGAFSEPASNTFGLNTTTVFAMASGDLDGDGRADVIMGNTSAG